MSDEEIRESFLREGGGFLLKHGIVNIDEEIEKYGIIDTPDIKEVEEFKRKIEEEEIEKVEGRGSFNIIKLKERSGNMMFDNYELKYLVEEFLDEEIDEEFEKALEVIPEKLREALKESYEILNKHKADMSEELLSAVKLLGRLATGKPGKYPYPEKVKKSEPMEWPSVMAQLFGGIDQADFEKSEIPEPSRENPFPSMTKAIEKKADKISQIEEELEEDSNYDDEDE